MRRPSLLYRLSVHVAARTAGFAARFDKKLARGLDGRRGLAARLAAWAATHRDPRRPLVWMHAPSVGEGLQAKPVLETLRAEQPEWQLAFTFFSPSAERLAKNLPVDVADYLPLDRPADVEAVLDALRPAALVFSKLDVWPELTLAAAHRGVKLGLISATVAPHSSRLRWPTRQWSHGAYQALDRIGTISDDDGRRLELLGARPEAIAVTGDTRYDSVAERAERLDRTREPLARLAAVASGKDTFTIVAGSTWPADEAVLLPAFADLLVFAMARTAWLAARASPFVALLVQSTFLLCAGGFMYLGFWRQRGAYRARYGAQAYRELFFRFLLPFMTAGSCAVVFPVPFVPRRRSLPLAAGNSRSPNRHTLLNPAPMRCQRESNRGGALPSVNAWSLRPLNQSLSVIVPPD